MKLNSDRESESESVPFVKIKKEQHNGKSIMTELNVSFSAKQHTASNSPKTKNYNNYFKIYSMLCSKTVTIVK